MILTESQIEEYNTKGYLFFPSLLDIEEINKLKSSLTDIYKRKGPEIIREKNDDSATRLAFGVHKYSESFHRLSLHPKILNPVKQLLNEDVYLHQSRLNPKQGFGAGASWDWHQDFPPFHKIDGMLKPKCIMASIFIDDCTTVKSPLLVLPGSHKEGLLTSSLHKDAKGKGYELHHITNDILEGLANKYGIEPLIGLSGSVAFVHCNVLHGSANNVSPWTRSIIYMNYNAVSNACTKDTRPWYQNNRDFSPLNPLDNDCIKSL